jgi:RNA polymerase sigma factor (sigma-70 family)
VKEAPQTVGSATVTSTALLQALRCSENRTAWQNFTERYYPLVWRFARRLGLGPADAEDAAQETLLAFARAYQAGQYDRDKGRLHDWLFGIARRQIEWVRRRLGREVQLPSPTDGTGPLERIPDDDPQVQLWEEEWQQAVLHQCLREIRGAFEPKTVEAFELFAWKGLSAGEVAARLGMTPNAVFLAKHKILKRIRELVPRMEEVW